MLEGTEICLSAGEDFWERLLGLAIDKFAQVHGPEGFQRRLGDLEAQNSLFEISKLFTGH
jgi:hypothetical protein